MTDLPRTSNDSQADTIVDISAPRSDKNEPAASPARRWTNPLRRHLVAGRLVFALIVASVTTAALYLLQYHPEQKVRSAEEAVLDAASVGTVAALSYKPASMRDDFEKARSHLTGDFLAYYQDFTEKVVGPAVESKGVSTTAEVMQSAVSRLEPESAVVLVFVNQWTVSPKTPEPRMTASSVNVGMRKVGDQWLISSFEPV